MRNIFTIKTKLFEFEYNSFDRNDFMDKKQFILVFTKTF